MTDLQTLLSPPTGNAPQEELDRLIATYRRASLGEALARAAELVRRYAGCEITHNIAGVLTAAAGRPDEALELYDRAIALAPDYAEALVNRGNTLKALNRVADALASFDAAIALRPNYAEAHLNRGIVLRMERRLDEALAANAAALRCNPRLVQAYNNRGNVHQELYRFEKALADYDKALKIDPAFIDAHLNRGNVLLRLKRLPAALASYDRVVKLSPAHVAGHRSRGVVQRELQRLAEALASFEKAHDLDPDDAAILSELLFLRAQTCCWTGPDRSADLRRRVREGAGAPPFHLLAVSDDPALQLANARAWANRQLPPQGPAVAAAPAKVGKIRIGYFSADFHNHATMALMIGLLERHDKDRFEIHAFSYGPDTRDAMRQRVVRAVDAFHDVGQLSDEAAARLARDHGIDIAVDLKGHTENARLGIFAWRPAPCRIGWLGYPGTAGTDCLEYLIADRVVIPDEARAFYAENVLYLPRCYQVNDSQRAIADKRFTRAELGLPETGFVFCCLNAAYKITSAEFDIWMRLLARVEGSALMLLDDNPWASANLRREAEARGVDPARLVFLGRLAMDQHLSRQRCADLFLDTFKVNAHTTASDALWAGLPVVTKLGSSFVARVGGSLLHAVGLPELVTESPEAYEALAYALATDPARLAAIRARLGANRTTAPLFDTAQFTRNIEDLFSAVVR